MQKSYKLKVKIILNMLKIKEKKIYKIPKDYLEIINDYYLT